MMVNVHTEPRGLAGDSRQRPDIQVDLPGISVPVGMTSSPSLFVIREVYT
jgi:hypothetical protein